MVLCTIQSAIDLICFPFLDQLYDIGNVQSVSAIAVRHSKINGLPTHSNAVSLPS